MHMKISQEWKSTLKESLTIFKFVLMLQKMYTFGGCFGLWRKHWYIYQLNSSPIVTSLGTGSLKVGREPEDPIHSKEVSSGGSRQRAEKNFFADPPPPAPPHFLKVCHWYPWQPCKWEPLLHAATNWHCHTEEIQCKMLTWTHTYQRTNPKRGGGGLQEPESAKIYVNTRSAEISSKCQHEMQCKSQDYERPLSSQITYRSRMLEGETTLHWLAI